MRFLARGGCLVVVAVVMGCSGGGADEATVFEDVGLVGADGAEAISRELVDMREAQEEASACMRAEGFSYVPWAEIELVADGITEAPPAGTGEFAEQRGYGILSGFADSIRTHPSAKQNPNQVLLDGLSDDERFVYMQTLQGLDFGARRDGVNEEIYDEGGCLGRAMRARGMRERNDLFGQLFGPYLELETRVNADERLVEYDREWSACMASEGFSYESSPSARAEFDRRFFELWDSVIFPAAEFSLEELRAMSPGEREELYRQEPVYDRQLLDAWLGEEIATAVADLGCQGSEPRDELFVDVLTEFEDEFLDQHASVIEQLTEAQG